MEIMTKEEYFEKMLEGTLLRLEEIENAMNKMTHNTDDDMASQMTNTFIGEALDIEGEELDCFVNAEFDEAYDAYVKANKPEHDYEVSFSFPGFSGTVHVVASSEDEAAEYVETNMDARFETDPCYMVDDEKVIDDIEMNYDEYDCCSCEIDDVKDCGVYEED